VVTNPEGLSNKRVNGFDPNAYKLSDWVAWADMYFSTNLKEKKKEIHADIFEGVFFQRN